MLGDSTDIAQSPYMNHIVVHAPLKLLLQLQMWLQLRIQSMNGELWDTNVCTKYTCAANAENTPASVPLQAFLESIAVSHFDDTEY